MEVDAKRILRELGIKVARESRNELNIRCPFHDDKHPSASINKKKLVFNCFSCGGMSLKKFVMLVSGKGEKYADSVLSMANGEMGNLESLSAKIKVSLQGEKDDDISEDDLDDLNLSYVGYLRKRKISRKTAAKWGVGYDRKSRRIVFPIRDHSGTLKGTFGRKINGDGPRYDLIHYCHPSRYLFGEYRLGHTGKRIVIEGPFPTIRMQKIGLPAVGVMKSQLTGSQIKRLKTADHVILAFDADKAGKKGTLAAIKHFPNAKIVLWKGDLDDLSPREIKNQVKKSKTPMEVKKIWREEEKRRKKR